MKIFWYSSPVPSLDMHEHWATYPKGWWKKWYWTLGKDFSKIKNVFCWQRWNGELSFLSQLLLPAYAYIYVCLFVLFICLSIYGEMFLLAFVLYRTVDKVRVHSEEVALRLNLTKSGTLGSTKFENMFRKNTPAAAAACPRPCVLHTYYCCCCCCALIGQYFPQCLSSFPLPIWSSVRAIFLEIFQHKTFLCPLPIFFHSVSPIWSSLWELSVFRDFPT